MHDYVEVQMCEDIFIDMGPQKKGRGLLFRHGEAAILRPNYFTTELFHGIVVVVVCVTSAGFSPFAKHTN